MFAILTPIEAAVSAIMVAFHRVFVFLGMDPGGGWTWALSIAGLVVIIRILLIPLFVKQIRSQRGLQLLQPQIKELQKKYKDDKEKQSQELMKLYRETKTNPLSSCLPILAQSPIFFALFRVLNGIAATPAKVHSPMTQELAQSAAGAKIFGAPIASSFTHPAKAVAANPTSVHIVAAVLILLMSASMFYTQRQLMTKNMPSSSLEGPFAQQQKLMLYIFPLIFLVSGINFPIGVLIYWLVTNVWSMGQQLYVIARMPAPGSLAEARLKAKRDARGGHGGGGSSAMTPVEPPEPRGQRQQPKRQARGKRQPPQQKRKGGPEDDSGRAVAS